MKQIDVEWLLRQADYEDSKSWIYKIIKWRDQVLRNNIFIQDDDEFILKMSGYKLHLKPSSSFAAIEVFIENFRESRHFKISEFITGNPALILDVGANQGFFSLRAKQLFPQCKMIAIEPNPNEFRILEKNIASNNIKQIVIDNIAIAEYSGKINMEIIPQIGSIGGKKIKIPERLWVKDEFIQTIAVPALSMDDLFVKYSIDYIDMVKIDTEGFEVDILKNTKVLNKIGKLVVEYHSQKLKEELIDLLCSKSKFDLVHEDSVTGSYYGELYFSNKMLKKQSIK